MYTLVYTLSTLFLSLVWGFVTIYNIYLFLYPCLQPDQVLSRLGFSCLNLKPGITWFNKLDQILHV